MHEEKMNIVTVDVSGHRIVRVAGEIDSVTAPRFEQVILGLLEPSQRIGLDCSGLVYVSSAGIRILLAAAKRVKGFDGRFELFSLSPMVHRMMEISCLTAILSIHPTEEDALEALRRP